jgi:hypothetical protein
VSRVEPIVHQHPDGAVIDGLDRAVKHALVSLTVTQTTIQRHPFAGLWAATGVGQKHVGEVDRLVEFEQ